VDIEAIGTPLIPADRLQRTSYGVGSAIVYRISSRSDSIETRRSARMSRSTSLKRGSGFGVKLAVATKPYPLS
jgi:hypothetical protein